MCRVASPAVSHAYCIHGIIIALQHCDDVIRKHFPELYDKARGTVINALVITSGSVALVKAGTTTWTLTMDRQEVTLVK